MHTICYSNNHFNCDNFCKKNCYVDYTARNIWHQNCLQFQREIVSRTILRIVCVQIDQIFVHDWRNCTFLQPKRSIDVRMAQGKQYACNVVISARFLFIESLLIFKRKVVMLSHENLFLLLLIARHLFTSYHLYWQATTFFVQQHSKTNEYVVIKLMACLTLAIDFQRAVASSSSLLFFFSNDDAWKVKKLQQYSDLHVCYFMCFANQNSKFTRASCT